MDGKHLWKGWNMTYDVLNKATKKQLIRWLRKNIFLPPISDEDFLRQIALDSLMEEQAALIDEHRAWNEKAASAKDQFELMRIMVELSKLSDRMEKNNKKIDKLMGRGIK